MVLFLAQLACAPPPYTPPDSDAGDSDTEQDSASTAASIEIVWPPQESSYTACAMFVVDVENFELVDFHDHPDVTPGQGHFHISWLDPYYEACVTPYCLIEFNDIPADSYVFTASLANNDHSDVLDDQGDPIAVSLRLNVTPGTCPVTTDGLE